MTRRIMASFVTAGFFQVPLLLVTDLSLWRWAVVSLGFIVASGMYHIINTKGDPA